MVIDPSGPWAPDYARCLPRRAESARAARELVSSALSAWAVDDEGRALLVVSELMSNAFLHGRAATVRISVRRMGPRAVRVCVVDRSHDMPLLRTPDDASEGGRGLTLVDALSGGRWGVEPLRIGKRVWAELTVRDGRCGE